MGGLRGGRTARVRWLYREDGEGTAGTYSEFATAPEALDDAEVVEANGCEEHLCRICEAELRRTSI